MMERFFSKVILVTLFALSFSFLAQGQRKVEKLGRGVVAINKGGGNVYISWRLFASDPDDISFNIYRSVGGGAATKLNTSPITATTDYSDNSASTTQTNTYFVKPVINGTEGAASGSFTLPAGSTAKSYITLPLQPLAHYSVNHVYVGDLNGDGEYDYIVKRFPASPYNNLFLEAYLNNGTFLWRIDLGPNMEQGNSTANPFVLVYDFDSDGKAEVLTRSGEGTIFADGTKIPDMNSDGITDYRTFPPTTNGGYMLLGDNCPEYISMVDGMTGKELAREDYIPRGPKSQWTQLWGDNYGHRMNFNFVGVAYFDGIHPSLYMSRGEGDLMDMVAWDYSNKQFTKRWSYSTRGVTYPNGQHWSEFHNIRIVDVDGDGKDEVCYGVNTLDDNGTPLYLADPDVGHGDRFVVTDLDPDRPGLECYAIQQASSVLAVLYDAKTGERIKTWSNPNPYDVGRGDAADIDPRYYGSELWSYAHSGVLDCKGNQIAPAFPHPALSIWWDGDLQRENLDAADGNGFNPIIDKWNYTNSTTSRLLSLYNEGGQYSTKTPYAGRAALYGDIMGDWREEIVCMNSDSTELRIFSTSIQASRRLYCLMQDPEYRLCINLKYYLPSTEVDYYLGEGMAEPPLPPVLEMKREWKGGNGNVWDISTSSNWITNDSPSMYIDGDSVMFDINGTGNTDIQISDVISPGYVVVNSPVDYTFKGTGELAGTTKLVKSGKSALTLHSGSTYSGLTKVDEGTLYVDTTLANSPVWVNWEATIGGKGVISQAVTLEKGAIIAPGTASSVGTITFSGGLTLPGKNKCLFDITDDSTGISKPSDKIMVTGDLAVSDTTFFLVNKIDGKVKSGLYPLISYSGAFNGNIKKISVSGLFGQKISLKDSINKIWLVVVASRGPGNVVWSGTGKDWDLLSTPNWLFNGVSDIFATGDSVLFDETGSGQYNVNLKGDLPIGDMVVETSANNYSFSGTGNIGGTGGITKNGGGVLSILNTGNSYTGKTVINNGVFILGGLDNAGLKSSIGASTSVNPANIVFNNTKVNYSGTADIYTDRGITLSGTQDTILVGTSGKTLSLSGVLAGTAKLVKMGAGTLYITGNANTFTGGTVIKQGTIQLNDPAATIGSLGSGSVALDGGTLTTGSSNNYTTCNMNFIVPDGSFGTLNTDMRCNYYGSLTGGGTLYLSLPGTIDRTIFFGDWSTFTGTINASGTSRLRLSNTNGYANATFYLQSGVTMYYSTGTTGGDAVSQTVKIGALAGASGSYLVDESWVIGGKNENSTFAGIISSLSVTKVGTGVLTLTGANTYSGATIINAGTIMVNNLSGSGTGTGNVAVNINGILAGTGTISGAVANSGTISPGYNSTGTLTINNKVTLNGTSILDMEVNRTSGSVDKISGSGTLKLGGNLKLSLLDNTSFTAGDHFKLFNFTTITGSFASIDPAEPGTGLIWDTTELRTTGAIWVKYPQSVNFADLTSKTYGDPDFTIDATSTSGLAVTFASSDESILSVSGNSVKVTGAGDATLTASQAGDNSYAKADDVAHLVTVNKANLTVTVVDTSRHVGEANPIVRLIYSGFVGTDSINDLEKAPLVSIDATVDSPVGTYDITLGQGVDKNYDFSYVDGKLTVTIPDGISLKNDLGLKIYPNPSSGILYISSSKAVTDVDVNIQDIQGKPVLIKRIPILNSPALLNLNEIPKGLYFIRLTIGTDTFIQKLVLK